MFNRETLDAELKREFFILRGGDVYERLVDQIWIIQQYRARHWSEYGTWWNKTTAGRAYRRQFEHRRRSLLSTVVAEIRWCRVCRKEFPVTALQIEQGRQSFCSRACAGKLGREAKVKTEKQYELHGVTRTLKEWVSSMDITPKIVRLRVAAGWTFERAISEPYIEKKKAACIAGHPRTEENVWTSKKTGYRSCRACNRERARKMARARREDVSANVSEAAE